MPNAPYSSRCNAFKPTNDLIDYEKSYFDK